MASGLFSILRQCSRLVVGVLMEWLSRNLEWQNVSGLNSSFKLDKEILLQNDALWRILARPRRFGAASLLTPTKF